MREDWRRQREAYKNVLNIDVSVFDREIAKENTPPSGEKCLIFVSRRDVFGA